MAKCIVCLGEETEVDGKYCTVLCKGLERASREIHRAEQDSVKPAPPWTDEEMLKVIVGTLGESHAPGTFNQARCLHLVKSRLEEIRKEHRR